MDVAAIENQDSQTTEAEALRKAEDEDTGIIKELNEYITAVDSAEATTRQEALEDLRFKLGNHWPDKAKKDREADGRPCLTINLIQKFTQSVVGQTRQNKPSINVSPVDSDSDPIIADILEGNIKAIEYGSDAPMCYDTALESAVDIGFGYFGLHTVYDGEDTFDQTVEFRPFINPFAVYYDYACTKPDGSDASRVAITELMLRTEFKRRWPNATAMDMQGSVGTSGAGVGWWGADEVMVAEYWRKEPIKKYLWLVEIDDGNGGRTEVLLSADHEEDLQIQPGDKVLDHRIVDSQKVVCYICSGSEVLEKAEWLSKYIPIFPVYGMSILVDGQMIRKGMIRDMKSPSLAYDYWYTDVTEKLALSPKTPMRVTQEQIAGHEGQWDQANRTPFPYLLYNETPAGAPVESPAPQIESARIQMLQICEQNLKAVTGIYEASLGQRSNETSGIAIHARQQEGDVSNFFFSDNLQRAITLAGKCLVDLLPKLYNKKRLLRYRGKDGKTSTIPVNQPALVPKIGPDGKPMTNPETGEPEMDRRILDVTVGKYDAVVTTGPSYATQRQEQVDALTKIVQAVPVSGPVIIPRLVKALDIQDADEMSNELKQLLAPAPPPMAPPGPPLPPGAPVPGGAVASFQPGT